MTERTRTLDRITVLDLTTFVTGGFCLLMLANQGAEVIKVERPDIGDDNRHSGPPFIEGESPYFWTVNYGKKSVELDLTIKEGKRGALGPRHRRRCPDLELSTGNRSKTRCRV